MNKIFTQLQKIKEEKRIGIMTHIVLGYPTLKDSIALVRAMAEVGVDFVELQIPFSDPMADGPTIMKANKVALEGGMTVDKAFEAMSTLIKQVSIPLLFMTYYNILLHCGVEKFCRGTVVVGASGLIVPDMPVDEEAHDHYWKVAEDNNLVAMRFLSTVSTGERITKVLDKPDRFLYFIGQKGTTGARASFNDELSFHLKRIRQHGSVSIAVGFGISKSEHIKSLKEVGADVAIVGSAVLNIYNETPKGEKIDTVKTYLETLVHAAE